MSFSVSGMAGRSFIVSFICACLLVCAPAARGECSPQAAASCAGADLKSRDLQGIDLLSDNFVKADLSRANLAGRSCKAPAWPAQNSAVPLSRTRISPAPIFVPRRSPMAGSSSLAK
jgi:uncharacterized protein YjbI with pentapeptide repeats